MPVVQDPQGNPLEFPDSMNMDQIAAVMRQQFPATGPAVPGGTDTPPPELSRTARFLQGAGDPYFGMVQLAGHVAPTIGKDSIDQAVVQREGDYQAKRAAAGQTGHDWYRTAGEIVGALPLAALAPVAPETLLGAAGAGALMGGANSLTAPVTDKATLDSGNYGMTKLKDAAIGAAAGGVTGGALNVLGRAINPAPSDALKLLHDNGVTPTLGQNIGKTAATVEDVAQPFAGFGQKRALDQFNKAAYNTVLAPIGEKYDGEVGRDAVRAVGDKLSAAYDQLVPNLKLIPDSQLQSDFAAAVSKTDEMSESAAKQFANIVEKQLPRGPMEGETLKKVQSALTQKIQQFSGSTDPSHQMMADAFSDIRTAITENLGRVNPDYADKLAAIDHGYANLVRLEIASGKTGEGVFTPNQLLSAARQADQSVRSRAIARGMGGDMQKLADAGVKVLGSKYPNSGTPARMAVGALETGGLGALGMIHPGYAAGIASTGLAMTPIGQKVLNSLFTQRTGQIAPLVGETIKRSALPFALAAPRLIGQ